MVCFARQSRGVSGDEERMAESRRPSICRGEESSLAGSCCDGCDYKVVEGCRAVLAGGFSRMT